MEKDEYLEKIENLQSLYSSNLKQFREDLKDVEADHQKRIHELIKILSIFVAVPITVIVASLAIFLNIDIRSFKSDLDNNIKSKLETFKTSSEATIETALRNSFNSYLSDEKIKSTIDTQLKENITKQNIKEIVNVELKKMSTDELNKVVTDLVTLKLDKDGLTRRIINLNDDISSIEKSLSTTLKSTDSISDLIAREDIKKLRKIIDTLKTSISDFHMNTNQAISSYSTVTNMGTKIQEDYITLKKQFDELNERVSDNTNNISLLTPLTKDEPKKDGTKQVEQ